jgi:hypothetical protein
MNKLTNETRIEVLSTIDELNQYLLGNVTIDSVMDSIRDLQNNLQSEY